MQTITIPLSRRNFRKKERNANFWRQSFRRRKREGCSFLGKKNGTNWSLLERRSWQTRLPELSGMKSKRRSGEGGEEGQSISCSIWNSRARRSVECVPCAARLAKDSWRTREIKGSHSFFRGKRKREIRAWRHDCLPNSKSHPSPPLYNNLSLLPLSLLERNGQRFASLIDDI